MGLTITEKEHFNKRVKDRVSLLTDQIKASDPTWKRDLQSQAIEFVEEQFGVQADMGLLEKLRDEQVSLATRVTDVERRIVATMRGLHPADCPIDDNRNVGGYRYNSPSEIPKTFQRYPGDAQKYMQAYCKYHLKQLKAAHPIGAQLEKLDDLRIDFEDEIAAAGSHKQLQDVWAKIKEKLGIFDADEKRQPRKVSTARANQGKKEVKA